MRYRSFLPVAVVLSSLGVVCAHADSTANVNPTMSMRTGVPLAACSTPSEEATSASGRTLMCVGGVWMYQGVSDIERVFVSQRIFASDIGTYKTLTAYCPAGKRALDGGCALLAGTTYEDGQNLFMDMVNTDLSGWSCGYGTLNSNATKQYYFFGWVDAGISAEVYCGIY